MSALDEFKNAVMREAIGIVRAEDEQADAHVRYSVGRYMGYLSSEPAPPTRELEPHEEVVMKLFFGMSEILKSVENLRNIAVYVRRFPNGAAGIDKTSYLRYHVENYFHELYILQERIDSYLTVVQRQYRRDLSRIKINAAMSNLRKGLNASFAGVVKTRGAHVHRQRFSDEELDRLTFFELIHPQDLGPFLSYEHVFREVRKSKRAWIESNNATIQQLLDTYFEEIRTLLLDDSGRLRCPVTG